MKIGFDNDKYLAMQSEHIRERIQKFDNKLYLEFGGKLFDDYHASRVLPGFQPDSKLQMLLQLKDQAEIVIVISAEDIVSSKIRGDYGITYDLDVLRLIDAFQGVGLYVGSVCVTKYTAAPEVEAFEKRLNDLGIRTFRHTARYHEPRGLFCGIGQCSDCVVVVNGTPNVRSCTTPLEEGMFIETQHGLGKVGVL